MGKKIDSNILRLIAMFILIFVIASLTKPSEFLTIGNFQTMTKQLSEYGLMAIGVGICMISGGIDLSTVYIANLCGIVAALQMQNSGNIFFAVIMGLLVGCICGIFNGFLVTYLKIPAMLATLGTYQLFMGIAIVISSGRSVSAIPDYVSFSQINIFGVIPLSFVLFIIIVGMSTFLMSHTKFGTRVYLIGTNKKAGVFAGINCNKMIIMTYLLSGVLSAISGLFSLSRINSAKADFGSSYTMQCILIAVLGGVNPNGGFGSVTGIAIATIILRMMSSYLNAFPQISNYYRDLIWGSALVIVLIVNYVLDKKRIKKLNKIS